MARQRELDALEPRVEENPSTIVSDSTRRAVYTDEPI